MRRCLYRSPAGGEHVWSLLIVDGRVTCRLHDGTEYAVTSQYLDQAWYRDGNGHWQILGVRRISFMAALRYLAIQLLPWWEEVHWRYSKAERKAWSHIGETFQGDVGNRVYHLTIQLALEVRRRHGLGELWTIEGLGQEAAGDVLEGMMGLAALGHPLLGQRHEDVRYNVEAAAVAVKEAWTLPRLVNVWDHTTLFAFILPPDVWDHTTWILPLLGASAPIFVDVPSSCHAYEQYRMHSDRLRMKNERSLALGRHAVFQLFPSLLALVYQCLFYG